MSEHPAPRNPRHPREIRLDEPPKPTPVRAPRAFELGAFEPGPEKSDPETTSRKRGRVEIEESIGPAPFESVDEGKVSRVPEPGFFSLSSLFWTAVSLLMTLYLADAAWSLVLSLEARSPWIGQLALGLIGIVALGILGFLLRDVDVLEGLDDLFGRVALLHPLLPHPDLVAARVIHQDPG